MNGMPVRMPRCRCVILDISSPAKTTLLSNQRRHRQNPNAQSRHPARSKRLSFFTRPTPARQDAPLHGKAAASEPPRRTRFSTSQALSEARTKQEIVFNVLKIKNPQGLTKTLRIAPATHPRQFPRPRGNVGQLSWQVFWLMVHPTPRAFPSEDVNRKSLCVKREDFFLRLTVHE